MGRAAFKAVEARKVPGGFDSRLFRRLLRKENEAITLLYLAPDAAAPLPKHEDDATRVHFDFAP